jgi:hypothetical protein
MPSRVTVARLGLFRRDFDYKSGFVSTRLNFSERGLRGLGAFDATR